MQNKEAQFRNLLQLNLVMLIMSTSGVLGKFIDLPIPVTIGGRALIASLVLFLVCKWQKASFHINRKDLPTIIAGGLLLGGHWLTYFYALKTSNVAIGMLSLFTYPVITSLLEPLLLKTKFQKMHLLLAGLVLVGVYFLVPSFSFENTYLKAVAVGIFSAVCYSLRNLVMKTKVNNYSNMVLMYYQLVVVAIVLSPTLFLLDTSNLASQWPYLVTLALLTTTIGHTLFLYSFKKFSITTLSIISSIQPVYGIILGILFLKEIPVLTTVFGGVLILTSVVIESARTLKS